jgi:hypothetical protein
MTGGRRRGGGIHVNREWPEAAMTRDPEPTTYLGDGVYAEFDGWMVKLTTHRADGEHVIYFEPEVYDALVRFARRCGWKEPAR